jgi:polyhydroxybutyrate depolymerase
MAARALIALMLLLAGAAGAQTWTHATQNTSCNLSFPHERCAYLSGEVDGQLRHGMVCRPAAAAGAPVLLAFHGHGGCAFQMAVSTRLHEAWPEALVVYPDGLTGTRTPNDPAGERTGWQLYPEQSADRDLRLVDELLAYLQFAYAIDASRVYATGHSNGSRFTGVLWAARPLSFRAFVFSAAQPGDLFARYALPAKPVALTMGRTDCIVPFNAALGCSTPVLDPANYQEASINLARRTLGIAEGATPWGLASERAASGLELGLYVHDGAHVWPADLTGLAVRFFQRN